MRADAEALKGQIEESVNLLRRHLDWDAATVRLTELNARAEDPTLWNDADEAGRVMRERGRLADQIEGVARLQQDVRDALDLIELAEAEGDAATADAAVADLKALAAEAKRREIESLLSGEADANDAFLEVNAGAGGTEAQDWAEMLRRMYTRWAEKRGYKVTITEESEGEQAGIKSATLQISGPNAYGWLKTESGVHRLVRISPFDAAARRQTSFASVYVYPVIDDRIEIEINPADLKTDTFRASGAGGQHVNKTESGVRFTHIPTGIVVASTQDRSQHRNRAIAMDMLRARLYELELSKREAISAGVEASKTDIGWGHQIRSYVLQPYQMVKDLRTSVEKGNPAAVLDGDLDEFMAAALAQRVGGTRSEASASAI
ncbi:Bacterial Peptide Chain Release Factor 2 (RF-2) [Roseomonas mucosa]|uniref:Peptide chain release factor 2 n=1 Tax=Roseomonas mucosa TaxID=207340 RepID=A0A1S8D3A6_9PROT|nr:MULTISPECIES: peptide chain release factor 2 [Roseomonas]MBS5902069.1 peptide chain release factor 2 [Acetobacteraceae bacterium]MDT8261697.1 peptide chain release factor 2 [Roseomonas sp. DSM 102946]ATR21168.1 peptide chain release factor 2 [Roseomonas sp. FDAARGOS_362]MCG7352313.1 peptide chain release factor 2 [Roseomonas mucosa]MCG7357377.1 peptide chain release factor 2 [Roseomonas mucosa]